MRLFKTLLAVASAALLLGALVSTASARSFSLSNQQVRAQFREVRFTLPFFTPSCQMTLEGSLHSRTIAKVVGSLIGYITAARLGPCASFTRTILQETLPWHVRYLGFTGTLPNITSIRTNVIGMSLRIREPFGIACLARSTETEPAVVSFNREAGGNVTTSEIGGTITTEAECFGEPGVFSSDRGPVTLLNSATTRINVRLI